MDEWSSPMLRPCCYRDTKRLYGCDGLLKILVEALCAAEPNGNLTETGRLLKNRELCRVRTCFVGDTLGSDLLPTDVLLAERRGILIDTVPLPVRNGCSIKSKKGTQKSWLTTLQQRTGRMVYRHSARRSVIPGQRSSSRIRRERHVRARRTHRVAYTSAGANLDRDSRLRPGSARGRTD